MKKPTVSEIRAHHEGMVARDEAAFYLLDLVERMGKALEGKLWNCNHVLSHDKDCEFCKEARALLEELGQ